MDSQGNASYPTLKLLDSQGNASKYVALAPNEEYTYFLHVMEFWNPHWLGETPDGVVWYSRELGRPQMSPQLVEDSKAALQQQLSFGAVCTHQLMEPVIETVLYSVKRLFYSAPCY